MDERTVAEGLRDEIDLVVEAWAYKLPGWLLATTDDPSVSLFLQMAVRRGRRLFERQQKELAVEVVNALARALPEGK